MFFNVSQLMKEPSGSRRVIQVDQKHALIDNAHTSRVRGTVNLLRTDTSIWVSANLDSGMQCACNLCLKEYDQPIHMTIEEEYFPQGVSAPGANLSGDGEETFHIDEHHILDMSEALRQYSELSLPMKPVCREGCAGICLTCGVNLNEATCECDKTPRDGRWGELLELVQADDSDS